MQPKALRPGFRHALRGAEEGSGNFGVVSYPLHQDRRKNKKKIFTKTFLGTGVVSVYECSCRTIVGVVKKACQILSCDYGVLWRKMGSMVFIKVLVF